LPPEEQIHFAGKVGSASDHLWFHRVWIIWPMTMDEFLIDSVSPVSMFKIQDPPAASRWVCRFVFGFESHIRVDLGLLGFRAVFSPSLAYAKNAFC